jgi:hypothetical protein
MYPTELIGPSVFICKPRYSYIVQAQALYD